MRLLNIYQYLVPVIFFPLSYYLWWTYGANNHRFVGLMLWFPVMFAYVVPGLGTNWLKLWEFNTRWRWGKFRPHHGFVFGTATSLFGLLVVAGLPDSASWLDMLRTGFVLGSVLAFWNWLYDIYAIHVGLLRVYNRPYAARRGAAAIATDYAPAIFGGFGLCYGILIRLSQHLLLNLDRWEFYVALAIGGSVAVVTVPVLIFIVVSYVRHGDPGLTPLTGGDP